MRILSLLLILPLLFCAGCAATSPPEKFLGEYLTACKLNLLKKCVSIAETSGERRLTFRIADLEYNTQVATGILEKLRIEYPAHTFLLADSFEPIPESPPGILIRLHPQFAIYDSETIAFFISISVDSATVIMYQMLVNAQEEVSGLSVWSRYQLQ